MFKIKAGKVLLDGVDITDRPILNYVTADGKSRLMPTRFEKRENWIEPEDNEGLYGIYFHGDLQCFVRGEVEARRFLQNLVDEEDYYNGNEKVDEFEL